MADYNINAVTRRKVFTGSAGLGPYAFTFEILDDDDLAVYFNATKLTKTTDYSVTINANGTGSVTLVVNVGGNVPQTPIASDAVIVVGARDIERTTDFVTAGDLLASSLNEQLDSLTIFDQQIAEEEKRTLQAPVYDPAHVDEGGTLDMTLPAKAARAGKTLQFNASTGNPEAGPTIDDVANAQTNANNAATSATAAATSATAAASSATSAAASATSATTAKTAAETAKTNAETAETNAETAETNAASSATAAAASASTASGHATTATTKASEAATSATTATTKASEASTSATNAASSATAAASSATASASSATSAANSAAAAAASLDSFDDRYLGSKTGYSGSGTGPSTDNDGNALVEGALFFSADANEMRVFDGSNWIAASSAGTASLILYEYTATSGQTTFSGSDDNSATLSYTANNLQVVMNGVILDPSDFTATSGTSVVLASGAATGDLINIYAFKSFTVSDTVSASAGGTFAGNVTVNALLNVDNLRLDGNTISSTDTNGDITIDPAGTGDTIIASGFVGIGTTSPPDHLSVVTSGSNAQLSVDRSDGGAGRTVLIHSSTGGQLQTTGSVPLIFGTADTERMRVTSSGTVGIGVTDPSTWSLGTALHIGNKENNLWGEGDYAIHMSQNAYYNSGWKYSHTDEATRYSQEDGQHIWSYAGSGSANAALTWSEAMRINTSGNLLIKRTNTNSNNGGHFITADYGFFENDGTPFFINRYNSNGDLLIFRKQNSDVGSISTNGSSTSYNTSSDYRLKENVTYDWDATTRLKQLKPARFNFIADADTTVDGFLAHEAQAVVPEAVTGTHNEVDDDGNPVMQGIDQAKLVPLLCKTILELEARITALEAE